MKPLQTMVQRDKLVRVVLGKRSVARLIREGRRINILWLISAHSHHYQIEQPKR